MRLVHLLLTKCTTYKKLISINFIILYSFVGDKNYKIYTKQKTLQALQILLQNFKFIRKKQKKKDIKRCEKAKVMYMCIVIHFTIIFCQVLTIHCYTYINTYVHLYDVVCMNNVNYPFLLYIYRKSKTENK